jgi:hypothetical protein
VLTPGAHCYGQAIIFFFWNIQAQAFEGELIFRLPCSCLESTHLNGAPRVCPVHIVADDETAIQDCVLLIWRLLLLGQCWFKLDVSLEEQ